MVARRSQIRRRRRSTEIATAAISVAAMVSSVIAAWQTIVHHDKVAREEELRRIMEMENRLLAKLTRNAAVHWAEIRERSVKLDHVGVKVTIAPAPAPSPRRMSSPPGTAVTRLLRASWVSTLSKRHYLKTVADTQRDHHDAAETRRLRRSRGAEARAKPARPEGLSSASLGDRQDGDGCRQGHQVLHLARRLMDFLRHGVH